MHGVLLSGVLVAFTLPLAGVEPPRNYVELGAASARPGEVVRIPVFLGFDRPLRSAVVVFAYDAARLEFLRFGFAASDLAELDPLAAGYRSFEGGYGILLIDDNRGGHLDLPPSERLHAGNLLFRVRARADTGSALVEARRNIPPVYATTGFSSTSSESFQAEILPGSALTVLPPSGPRPVDDLRCEQFLDRVRLSFTPTEDYDQVLVSRNETPLATLPGDAASFEDPLPGLGALTYGVMGRRGAEDAVSVSCELTAVSPAAPPVKDLTCNDAGLSWKSPITYEAVTVLRNSEPIAELPGDALSYSDPNRPSTITLYAVVGEIEGFRSPQTTCVDHGVWIIEVGDVEAALDAEEVAVPIYVTTSLVVNGFDAHLDMDISRLTLIKNDLERSLAGTVGHPEPEFLAVGIGHRGGPSAGLIYDQLPPREPEKYLQPGLRQHALNFPFRRSGSFVNGESIEIRIFTAVFTHYVGNRATSQSADYIGGQIRFGSSGIAAVRRFEARVAGPDGAGAQAGPHGAPPDVRVTWENGSAYDAVRIERNGTVLIELPGSATQHVDAGVARGVYTYKAIGILGGKTSFPASALLSTFVVPEAFLRGDANRDSAINITDPILSLEFLFRGGPAPACEDAADVDDDGTIGITDAIVTLQYLFLGVGTIRAPGALYPWFDPTPDALGCDG